MPLSKVKQALYQKERRRRLGMIISCVIPEVPLYNPTEHRVGDTVRVLKGRREVVVTIPEVDADGNAIPDYEH